MTLSALIARVEEGTEDRDLHADVLESLGTCVHRRTYREECDVDGYDIVCSDCGSSDLWLGMNPVTSLDAVLSLIEQKLPGANCHGYDLTPKEVVGYVSRNCIPASERAWMYEGHAKTPARALLAAALRALSALEDSKAERAGEIQSQALWRQALDAERSDHVVWLRDLDGTGSMHVCSQGDPGAVEYVPAWPPLEHSKAERADANSNGDSP